VNTHEVEVRNHRNEHAHTQMIGAQDVDNCSSRRILEDNIGYQGMKNDCCGMLKAVVARMDDGIQRLTVDCCGTSRVVTAHMGDVKILWMVGVLNRRDRVVVVRDVVSIVSYLRCANCLWNIIPLIECLLAVLELGEVPRSSMSFPDKLPQHIDF